MKYRFCLLMTLSLLIILPRLSSKATTSPASQWIAVMNEFNGHDIYLVNVETGEAELLREFYDALADGPWWASDGSWFDVAMFENHDTKRIFRFDMATQEFTPLASFGWFSPTLSPERDRLAILANVYHDGVRTNELQVMTLDETLLGSFDIGAGTPVWSPDGQWLAFTIEGQLHRMRPDGTNLEPLTPAGNLDVGFSWSPDSSQLAFLSRDADDETSRFDLYVVNADGSELKAIVTQASFSTVDGQALPPYGVPAWSPDGTMLAFVAGYFDDRNIYRVQADGSELIKLTNTPNEKFIPQWSPDGQWIAYAAYTSTDQCPSCGGKNLELIDINGDNHRQLTTDLNVERFAWSPLPVDD